MKVLLVQPPVRDFYDTDIRLQPIGLCYIKSALREHLPEVETLIRDYHAGHGRKTVPIPEELSYLKEYYPVADKSPFSTFHQYYHFGKSFDEIEAEINDIAPDLVGISSLFTPYYREALEIAERVKNRLNVPVVMGGPHVSEVPHEVLTLPSVDYVILGEGERPMVEFVRFLLGQVKVEDVPNLGYKRDNRLHFNPVMENYPIEELTIPDLGGLSEGPYQLAGKPLAFMITSRGCPHRCSFCSVHTTFGNNYRRRPVEDVIEEIKQRHREGRRVIDFEDDNLTFYKDEFKELCRRLIELFPERQMEFVAMNGISYMSLDNELLELMSQAGFTHLNLALVSSDKSVHETTKRPYSLNAYAKVVGKSFQLGLKIVSYQILGLPDESLPGMVRTLAFNSRLPVLLGASPFYLTPKSPIAIGMDLTGEDYIKARLTAMASDSDLFTRDDIYTLFITTRTINFLKGLDIDDDADINEILNKSWPDKRVNIGIELLRDIGRKGVLFFYTSKGKIQNKKFKTELFRHVIREAGHITCQNGRRIDVGSFFSA
ncbi:MAG: B12-binding domain-containing radical SAM protein [Nitrospirae bacterium]|nr:B12-binding domain-containing radical SAM protein [Nitrospirota bacterium]